VLYVDYTEYETMPLEQLTAIREHALDRVHKVTEAMKLQAKVEHQNGVPVKKIARKANVSRPTVYAWLAE
jgi:hypothetical protein